MLSSSAVLSLSHRIDHQVEGVHRSPFEELLSALSHGIGFIAALVGTTILLMRSSGSANIFTAVLIYSAAMCAVFAASTIYHGLPPSPAKRIFRIIDHTSIYIMIAATYTPLTVVMDGVSGEQLLVAVWSLCAMGLLLNFMFWDRLKPVHISVYLLMGWLAAFFWQPLAASLAADQINWMLAGGVAYTVGLAFYLAKRVPFAHVIWHLFVIAGTAAMYMAVSSCVVHGTMA